MPLAPFAGFGHELDQLDSLDGRLEQLGLVAKAHRTRLSEQLGVIMEFEDQARVPSGCWQTSACRSARTQPHGLQAVSQGMAGFRRHDGVTDHRVWAALGNRTAGSMFVRVT